MPSGSEPMERAHRVHENTGTGTCLMTPDLLANKNQRAQICARYLSSKSSTLNRGSGLCNHNLGTVPFRDGGSAFVGVEVKVVRL